MATAEKIAAEKLLSQLQEEFANTRKFLERVPDDKLGWKPHEKSMALGRLAWHLTDMPVWCKDILKTDHLSMTSEQGKQSMHDWEGKKRADMLARFDQDLPEVNALLAKASESDLSSPWKMEWDGQVIIDGPREDIVRKWVVHHMIHHRAQLGVYLRLNEIPIPGPYGPSADEM
jgi:uncharacterized damage-inducible protein DinB